MDYRTDVVFHKVRSGTIVRGVPISHQIFFTAINRPRTDKWISRRDEITDFPPVYFCKKCRQIEDGAHRIARLYSLKEKFPSLTERVCDVRVMARCYKSMNSGYQGYLEAALHIFKSLKPDEYLPLDHAWIGACRDKWALFGPQIALEGKRLLDIGTQTGYTPLEAVRRGAKYALGIEQREPVLRAAGFVRDHLGLDNVEFMEADWDDCPQLQFDIVTALGILHYFPADKYERLFRKMLYSASETVVIEMRLRPDREDVELTTSGVQTLPTAGWFKAQFRDARFKVKQRFVRKPGVRELWIAERP